MFQLSHDPNCFKERYTVETTIYEIQMEGPRIFHNLEKATVTWIYYLKAMVKIIIPFPHLMS